MKNPKVYFLFYEYFLRAVRGEKSWDAALKRSGEGPVQFSTCNGEAFTFILLENNYFAWLFNFQEKGAKIRTEYDTKVGEMVGEREEKSICDYTPGEEWEIGMEEEGDAKNFIINDKRNINQVNSFNAARVRRISQQQATYEEIILLDTRQEQMTQVEEALKEYEVCPEDEQPKKRRKLLRELREYTGGRDTVAVSATRKEERRFKGWSERGMEKLFDHSTDFKKSRGEGWERGWTPCYKRLKTMIQEEKEKKTDASKQEKYRLDVDSFYEL